MNWFTWIIFFIIVYVIQKIGGNDNSLNLMLYYDLHGEKMVITRQFLSMPTTTLDQKFKIRFCMVTNLGQLIKDTNTIQYKRG